MPTYPTESVYKGLNICRRPHALDKASECEHLEWVPITHLPVHLLPIRSPASQHIDTCPQTVAKVLQLLFLFASMPAS